MGGIGGTGKKSENSGGRLMRVRSFPSSHTNSAGGGWLCGGVGYSISMESVTLECVGVLPPEIFFWFVQIKVKSLRIVSGYNLDFRWIVIISTDQQHKHTHKRPENRSSWTISIMKLECYPLIVKRKRKDPAAVKLQGLNLRAVSYSIASTNSSCGVYSSPIAAEYAAAGSIQLLLLVCCGKPMPSLQSCDNGDGFFKLSSQAIQCSHNTAGVNILC